MSIVRDIVGGLASGAGAASPTGAVSAVANVVAKVIDWVHPDPAVAAEIALKLQSQEGQQRLAEAAIEAGLVQGQLEINKIEAGSGNWFAASWRPAAGWVGVSALFFSTTVVFAVQTGVWLWQCIDNHALLPAPSLDTTDIFLLLGQLLGLGVLRSFDKVKGVSPG